MSPDEEKEGCDLAANQESHKLAAKHAISHQRVCISSVVSAPAESIDGRYQKPLYQRNTTEAENEERRDGAPFIA